MKGKLTLLGFLFSLLSFGKADNDSIQVIARLVSSGQGKEIHTDKYKVLKVLKGKVNKSFIDVYYYPKDLPNSPDTVLLHLLRFPGDTNTVGCYMFPDYDAKKGIEKVKLSYVSFDDWEKCETGIGDCKPLTFTRNLKTKYWFLIMPCGGSYTTLTLSQKPGIPKENDIIQKEEISNSECPPIFNLTQLEDGKYFAYMLACSLGGQIELNLKTEKE